MGEFLTPSGRDLKSICELRKSTGLGCANCVYLEVCSDKSNHKSRSSSSKGASMKSESAKRGARSKTAPQTIGSNRKRVNKPIPIRCIESNEVYDSLGQAARIFNTTRGTLQKYIDAHQPITITLTFEYLEGDDND